MSESLNAGVLSVHPVATDESLKVFLDSYLHFRRRWFDNPLGWPNVSVVAGDGDLSRRVFMVLFRM